ncbi:MAG: NRDE family protein [Planctomycetia bacterium]|nr:NRDE family protein [Planctomycetia bacterium]
MCTLSVIPWSENPSSPGIRLVVNRDESRLRPQAMPPTVEMFGERQAILPRDRQAGGTWVGVNDAGLAMVLLNAPGAPPPHPMTRGAVIPALLDAADFDEAVARAERFDTLSFAPFRLVILDRTRLAELAFRDWALALRQRIRIERPAMFTSSGLGDAEVAQPRNRLFAEMFLDSGDWFATQDAFHRHRWPWRADISVNMSRPEASTVSQTIVEITKEAVRMTYHGAPPDQDAMSIALSLRIDS